MNAPTGTVTLVFAEADRAPGGESVLKELHADLRSRLAAAGGFEVKSLPGIMMVAFSGAGTALGWALAAQEASVAAGLAGLRVGIATGEAMVERDPATERTDYFGPTVNRAARIMAAANAGQTLLSEAAHASAAGEAGEFDDTDLGEHRLRGIERPERLHQALPPPWKGRAFPSLRTFRTLPTNLPPQTSSFVGREDELGALGKLLEDPGVRVVTLTGGAGVGKTRLAVRAAAGFVDRLPGGVWFADAVEAAGAEGIAGLVAEAMGISGGPNPVATVGAVLELRGAALVVLDTFDPHLAHAAATIGVWAARAPLARFLITSRAATALPGERELRLEPLPVGTADSPGPALRLFADRAREARPDFELGPKNAADVARICEEVEGLPLAIELAAARVRILQPSEIVKKLGQKFQLLRSARKDAAPRQQTLQGAIEWSEEQLSPWERSALRQFSVFRGGCDADAADAVVDLSGYPGASGGAAAARALVARSLLSVKETDLGTRFEISRTVREYAEARTPMEGLEGRRAAEARHAAHFSAFATRIDAVTLEARDRIRPEIANLFAIQDRIPSLGPGAFVMAATVLAAARHSLQWSGPIREGLDRISRLRREALDAAPLPGKLGVSLSLGHLRLLKTVGNWREALVIAEETIVKAREINALALLAEALWEVAYCAGTLADYRRSDEALDEAERLARDGGYRVRLMGCLHIRSARTRARGNVAESIRLAREAFEIAKEIPDREDARSESMNALANQLADGDDPVEAVRMYRVAIEIDVRIGNDGGRATKLGNLGDVLVDMGDPEGALRAFREAIDLDRRLGRSIYYAYERIRESGALRLSGDLAAARLSLDEGELLLEAVAAAQLTVLSRMRRAEIFFDAGDFAGALAAAQAALKAAEQDEDIARSIDARVLGARALLGLGRPEEARAVLSSKSTGEAAAGLSRLVRFGLLSVQALVEEACANRAEARRIAHEALALAEGVRATYSPANERFRIFAPALERIARG